MYFCLFCYNVFIYVILRSLSNTNAPKYKSKAKMEVIKIC